MNFNTQLWNDLIGQLNYTFNGNSPFLNNHMIYNWDIIEYKYQYNTDLINHLLYLYNEIHNTDLYAFEKINRRNIFLNTFDSYVEEKKKKTLSNSTQIDERIIRYAFIDLICRVPYSNGTSSGKQFLLSILKDNVADHHTVLNIASQYIEYMKECSIIENIISLCKLTNFDMDIVSKYYKNGNMNILNHFLNYGIIPSENQIHMLISNKNTFDESFIKKFNVDINAEYIIANIKAGNYNILGVKPKQKWIFNDDQKNRLSIYIFENNFTKSQIESMRKTYNLTFTIDSLITMCKYNGSIPIFNYLVDLGITPTVECLYYIIPKHCSHSRIRDILIKSMNK